MRVVIDTGVIISAALQPEGTSNKALLYALFNSQPLISFQTYHELVRVLNKSKFSSKISEVNKNTILNTVLHRSINIETTSNLSFCRDANDDMFLNLAIDGKAEVIITRDPDLLILHPFQNIQILNPADFLLWVRSIRND